MCAFPVNADHYPAGKGTVPLVLPRRYVTGGRVAFVHQPSSRVFCFSKAMALSIVCINVADKKTCKDDFTCPRGFLNVGDKECRDECDERECCEKGEKVTSTWLRVLLCVCINA